MKRDTSEVNVRRTNDGRVGFLRSCSSPASINPYLGGGMILFRSKKFRIFFTAIDESEQAFEVLNILIRLISFVWIPNTFIIFLDLWIDGFPWIFRSWDVFVLFFFLTEMVVTRRRFARKLEGTYDLLDSFSLLQIWLARTVQGSFLWKIVR